MDNLGDGSDRLTPTVADEFCAELAARILQNRRVGPLLQWLPGLGHAHTFIVPHPQLHSSSTLCKWCAGALGVAHFPMVSHGIA